MAEAAASHRGLGDCFNCLNYEWKQAENRKACAKCKLAYYCSKECQKEHWVKLHRKQCSKLANPSSAVLHSPADCWSCRAVDRTGQNSYLEKESLNICCAWTLDYPSVMSSLPERPIIMLTCKPGEISGVFLSETMQAASLIRSILVKLIFSKHPMALRCNSQIKEFLNILLRFRETVWLESLVYLPGELLTQRIWINFNKEKEELMGLVDAINRKTKGTASHHSLALINIKVLLAIAVGCADPSRIENHALLPEIREKRRNFRKIQKAILEVMSSEWKLLTMERIVEIFLSAYGEKANKCNNCLEDINVTKLVFQDYGDYTVNENGNEPICFPDEIGAVFLCGKQKCVSDNIKRRGKNFFEVLEDPAFHAKRCHMCFKINANLKRCGKCKSKVYCGIECLHKDWELVHKDICGKGDVERKQKEGKTERKMQNKKAAADFKEKCLKKMTA